MLIGQSVIAPASAATILYSPWFPRQGNEFTAVIQVLRASGTVTFTCQVKTKNNEDSDSAATSIGGAITVATGTGGVGATTTAVRTGCKELVRYEFSVKGGVGSDQWVHFRSNAPLWETN